MTQGGGGLGLLLEAGDEGGIPSVLRVENLDRDLAAQLASVAR
jgi:hypothetical protein